VRCSDRERSGHGADLVVSEAAAERELPVATLLTRNSVLAYMDEVTVAPVTTTIRDIPTEVLLGPDDGLPRECAVNCDHLQTVAKAKIGPLITALSETKLRDLVDPVRFSLDF